MEGQPQSSAAPVAESSDAQPVVTGQPASGQIADVAAVSDASMDDWIRTKAFGSSSHSTLTPDGVVPTAELEAAASGESAPHGDVSPGDVPPGDGTAARPQGRRSAKAAEAAVTIESLQAKLADVEKSIPERVAEATRAADEARAEAAALRAQQEGAQKQVYDLIGNADEYTRLLQIPDAEISNEDYQKREAWKANRQVYRPLEQQYHTEASQNAQQFINGVRQQWGQRVLQVADKYGLDRAYIADPKNHDLDALLSHTASVTEARVRNEYAERLSQAERDRDAARGEAVAGYRAPITNGAASGAGAGGFDVDNWIRQRAGFA